MNSLVGKKQNQTQGFLQDGTRVPLTVISAMGNWVTQIKDNSIQLGFDINKKPGKREKGIEKKAGLQHTPRFFREIKGDIQSVQVGSQINPSDVFKPGDIIDVSGVSKGKGFAGGVKRHHFKGGPRTHGQSDRERAPGSIGQTTTPGHVYRGKRMAGHMGHKNSTAKNLEVIEITNDGAILVKGLIPGGVNNIVVVTKVGENKKFVPLFKEEVQVEQKIEEQVQPEVKTEAPQEPAQTATEHAAEGIQTPAEEAEKEEVVETEKKEEVKENAQS